MSKRPTRLDRAIANLDDQITEHTDQIKALQMARAMLVKQQAPPLPGVVCVHGMPMNKVCAACQRAS